MSGHRAGAWAAAALLLAAVPLAAQKPLAWSDLPVLPAGAGTHGVFAGTMPDGALVVAGGMGGATFRDAIFVLERDAAEWRDTGRLPAPRAHGASVTTGDALWLLGGDGDGGPTADTWRLRREPGGQVVLEAGPPLPRPSAFHAATYAAGRVWLLPGDAREAFWSLDPARPADGWREQEPCPGGQRAGAALAAQKLGDGRIAIVVVVAGGARPGEAEPLADAWCFVPGSVAGAGWRRLADLPRPLTAAAFVALGASHLLLFARDQRGAGAVLAYHTITDTWIELGAAPPGAAAVAWRDGVAVFGAAARPRFARPAPRPPALGHLDAFVLVLYLAVVVAMGAWFARRNRGSDDYFLAGRRLPWWAAGLSIYGTQISSITFLATPALAYATDLRYAPTWIAILLVVPLVTRVFLPRLRRLGTRTAYEYLERRYSLLARRAGSGCFLAMQAARMGIVVYLPSLALATVSGLEVRLCILVIGVLATLYTVLGGMAVVVWTDVLQVFVILGGVLLALLLAFAGAGGMAAFQDAAGAAKLRLWDGGFAWTEAASWSLMLGSLVMMVPPYTVDQTIVQRYLSARDDRDAARAAWLNGWLSIPAALLFPALGACLWAFYRQRPEALQLGMPNDGILPLFLGDHLPDGLAGLVLAGLLAATMSTLDSSMHSIATAVVNDFYRPARPAADDATILRAARRWTVAAGAFGTACAVVLASFEVTSLFLLFLQALGLLSSGLATLFLLGIFCPRVGTAAALGGAAFGTVALGWLAWSTGLHTFWYAAAGIGLGMAAGCALGRLPARGGAAPR